MVNGDVVILNIWDIDEAMHCLYQTKLISKERKIYNSKANSRCLLAHKRNHYAYLRGSRGRGGVCRPLPLDIVASLSRLLSLSSLLKCQYFSSIFFILSCPSSSRPLSPLFPCQALIFSTDQENNNLCLSYCLYDKPYLLVYFFIFWLWH